MKRDRKILQVDVDCVAKPRIDSGSRGQNRHAAKIDEQRLHQAQSRHESDRPPDVGRVARFQGSVNKLFQGKWNAEGKTARNQSYGHPQNQTLHVGTRVRHDARKAPDYARTLFWGCGFCIHD